jgi:hypothetical protein
MRIQAFLVYLLTVSMISCQTQEVIAPVSALPYETPIHATADLSTQTPSPIICLVKPPLVELNSLPKIPKETLPPSQANATMVYDLKRELIVMLGGEKNPITWEYNGLEWKQVMTKTSPPTRTFFPAMAYDKKREVIVLYGGWDNTGKNLHDAWEYDGVNWREAVLENTPEQLRLPSMIYYPPRKQIILFGQYQDSATYQTWAYDGNSWENLDRDLPDIPLPSMFYKTVYDSCRQKLYLVMLSDWLYEFDGTWQILSNKSGNKLSIEPSSVVYDSFRDRLVHYGAAWENYGDPWRSETWEFDGVDWQQVQPLTSPTPRLSHAMVFDEARGVTVIFGGVDENGTLLNDLWEYDGTTWVQR